MPAKPTPRPASNRNRRPGPLMPSGLFFLGLVLLAVVSVSLYPPFQAAPKIKYSEFQSLVKSGKVKKITLIGSDRVKGELKDEHTAKNDDEVKKMKLTGQHFSVKLYPAADRQSQKDEWIAAGIEYDNEDDLGTVFWPVLAIILTLGMMATIVMALFLPRNRDPFNSSIAAGFIKSPARRFDRSKLRTMFDDVAGLESAKRELQEIVDFLKNPAKFQAIGAQVPKGVLLVGPPGTGKTLLARAVAGEANVPFFSINGSEFIQMFVGVGASRVRDMFKSAKESSPCLLFIDEIDAVGRMRGAGLGGGSDEREQTLNQILSEMDGFMPTETVIVLAATNRPDVLDPALLRPGRFDRHVTIDRPTWKGRLEILKVHTRNKPLAPDVELETIARSTAGMTGADLRNLANEAALLAARDDRDRIDRNDFLQAADRVLRGPKREEMLTPEGRRRTAYHEAGHALVAWLEPLAEKPFKVSIIPRGRSLGVNLTQPDEDRFQHGTNYFKAQLAVAMGGRAADRLIFGEADAGAESDLKQATKIARTMVTHWGMSERLGPVAFRIGEEHVFLGKEIQEPRDFSEGTASLIDSEVQELLREADERAYRTVQQNQTLLDAIVEALLANEELDRTALDQIIQPAEHSGQISSGAQLNMSNRA